MENRSEHLSPKPTISDRLRKKWDHWFHPASSASKEAFTSIIAVLPPGEMKKSMELVTPQLKDMLKVQDRTLVMSSFLQRAITSTVFGIFGATGGSAVGLAVPVIGPIYGGIAGIGTGIATAFAIPTASQMERSRIGIEATKQTMMLRTTGGKEAAKVFDSTKVDQITQAILWGAGATGGAGGVLSQASNPN